MKTVHLSTKSKSLIKQLYKEVLKKDKSFHFFYEPELIIRVENKTLRKLKKALNKRRLKYKVYDYPYPKGYTKEDEGTYCFECSKTIRKYLDHYKKLYHLHSVAALTFTKVEWEEYIGRVIHTACNIKSMGYYKEGQMLVRKGLMMLLLPHDLAIDKMSDYLCKKVKEK